MLLSRRMIGRHHIWFVHTTRAKTETVLCINDSYGVESVTRNKFKWKKDAKRIQTSNWMWDPKPPSKTQSSVIKCIGLKEVFVPDCSSDISLKFVHRWLSRPWWELPFSPGIYGVLLCQTKTFLLRSKNNNNKIMQNNRSHSIHANHTKRAIIISRIRTKIKREGKQSVTIIMLQCSNLVLFISFCACVWHSMKLFWVLDLGRRASRFISLHSIDPFFDLELKTKILIGFDHDASTMNALMKKD